MGPVAADSGVGSAEAVLHRSEQDGDVFAAPRHARVGVQQPILHWGGPAAYHGVLHAQHDGARLLRDIGEHYDAYSDIGPLSSRFDLLELQYPGSKFILTVDVDEWVESRRKHVERNRRTHSTGTNTSSNLDDIERCAATSGTPMWTA